MRLIAFNVRMGSTSIREPLAGLFPLFVPAIKSRSKNAV